MAGGTALCITSLVLAGRVVMGRIIRLFSLGGEPAGGENPIDVRE
jgi:hypothetical protein